jgi:hypothetical protein
MWTSLVPLFTIQTSLPATGSSNEEGTHRDANVATGNMFSARRDRGVGESAVSSLRVAATATRFLVTAVMKTWFIGLV